MRVDARGRRVMATRSMVLVLTARTDRVAVFLKATRDIQAGDELLVTYGTTYHALHFEH